MNTHIQDYYKAVCEAYSLGNIESAYYKPIIALFSGFGCAAHDLSGERGGQSGENIDIKLWREDEDIADTEPFAGIEAKKVGGIDDRAIKQAGISAARYGNVILTDNIEWRFYNAGCEKMYAGIKLIKREGDNLSLIDDNIELFISLIEDFMLKDPAQIRKSGKLAEYMAKHARTIRNIITGILKDDGTGQPLTDERQKKLPMFSELYGLYSRIKAELRPLLTSRGFADMYAQTIVYGLFIARYNDADNTNFDRYKAIESLREESALLNRFFTHIASTGKTHPTLEAVIDKLCVLYQTCDISALLDQDARRDTIVHFYEDFLAFYDPELRKALGVFYTPIQVVRYLVSMVDRLLVEEFGVEGGLSNNEHIKVKVPSERYQASGRSKKWLETKEITVPRIAILDPACGTGTFHAEIIRHIKNTYFSGVKEAFYDEYIQTENGLLSRMIGFEIMITSYAVAHLKIRRTIVDTLGYAPSAQLPANIFLTNTLTLPKATLERGEQMNLFDFSAAIADEAYNADTWKSRRPIKVIVGNPPYFAASINPYDISAYRTETDGVSRLRERNSKMLSDDYAKFFRFAEQIINRDGDGILAYVSNNGYLDNPTFRGMRASLLRTFDRIYIVDLHGNAKKKEVTPDGGKDENIFDIMQGVSLFIGIKTTNNPSWAKVYHADIWGTREKKFHSLANNTPEYKELRLDSKMAYFVPFADDSKDEYSNGISITDLFPTRTAGVDTGNDKTAIAPNRQELERRLDIVKNALDDNSILKLFGKFTDSQTAEKIQNDVLNGGVVTPIVYRLFDVRWTFYTGNSGGWLDRPREKQKMKHLMAASETPIGKNAAICFARLDKSQNIWSMIFLTDKIAESCILTTQTAGRATIAPLYLHNEQGGAWTPNLDPKQLQKLTQHLTAQPSPIEIFDYCYGILYDPVYREKYNEFLKRDFPRVPVIENLEVFRAYVSAGERLRRLHLMQTKIPAALALEPSTAEDLEIGAVKYKNGVLHLNANKRVIGIRSDVWNYRIGGYQVIDKWLKSHKGKTMTANDFDHIANIAGLLAETIKIQEELRSMHD